MERAASKCANWIYHKAPSLFPKSITEERDWLFHIVVGPGNNGGDGLVIARLLQKNGYAVEISVVRFTEKESEDFEANFKRLGKLKNAVNNLYPGEEIPDFPDNAVIIDAIFGTGLNRPAEGVALDVIQKINESQSTVVSIDLPSGMFCEDNSENNPKGIVKADFLLTFQAPKLCLFLTVF